MNTEIVNWTELSPGAVLQRRDTGGVVYFDGLVETNDLMFRCTSSTSGESYTLFKRDFVLADPYVELNIAQKTLHRRRYPAVYGEASSKGESAFNTQEGGEHYSSLPEGYPPFQISKAFHNFFSFPFLRRLCPPHHRYNLTTAHFPSHLNLHQ